MWSLTSMFYVLWDKMYNGCFYVIYIQSNNVFDNVDTTIIRNTFSYIFCLDIQHINGGVKLFFGRNQCFLVYFFSVFLFSISDNCCFETKKISKSINDSKKWKYAIKKSLEKMCLGVDRSLSEHLRTQRRLNPHKMFLALKFKEHL
jgi:hypothetical protein